jgi:hypothetical protein
MRIISVEAIIVFIFAALESIRINLFSEYPEQERQKLIDEGFSFKIPPEDLKTPQVVIEESKWCNTPVHRRKKAKDKSVM